MIQTHKILFISDGHKIFGWIYTLRGTDFILCGKNEVRYVLEHYLEHYLVVIVLGSHKIIL